MKGGDAGLTEGPKTDLRVVKTKNALLNAMMTLLKTKPLDRITVSDLCETASIRRATFYAHFRDKEDFLEYCLAKKQERFESVCGQADFLSGAFYETAVRDMIRFMRENQPLLKRTENCGSAGAMRLFTRQFSFAIGRMLAQEAEGGRAAIASAEVLAPFFAGSVLGVVRWYCEAETPMAEDALVEQVGRVLSKCAATILVDPLPHGTEGAEAKKEKADE